MTTPEQLAKYRQDFEAATASRPMLSVLLYQKNDDCKYSNHAVESEWQGYLRRCQETEQAMKLAKRETLEQALAICNGALSFPDAKYYIRDKIKELLK